MSEDIIRITQLIVVIDPTNRLMIVYNSVIYGSHRR